MYKLIHKKDIFVRFNVSLFYQLDQFFFCNKGFCIHLKKYLVIYFLF